MATEVYKSLEVPVRWKSSEPGFVLTSGITNVLEIKLKDHPTAGDRPLTAGYADLSIFSIPKYEHRLSVATDIELNADMEHISVPVELPAKFGRGYYKGHLIVKDMDKKPLDVYEMWLVVDKCVEPKRDNYLSLTTIRSQFADICEFDNKMLDSLEVGIGDIASAVNRCLEQWDSVAPRVTKYTGHDFPYPELLMNGVLFKLLQSLTTLLGRNKMLYNAGGVQVDLEARLAFFNNLKQTYEAYWRSGVAQIKAEENLNNFYGSLNY